MRLALRASPRWPGRGLAALGIVAGLLLNQYRPLLESQSLTPWLVVLLIGGIVGSLCVGLLSTVATNAAGTNGLFYGGGVTLLGKQALAVICVIAYSALM